MRIKKIDVIGFKSFYDRVVLTIDQPITTVVGPNGCGKSNVVDAIRWCMGEQSAKHLRGRSMDDVIFAGSETRDPAGVAEVSLTFENVAFEPTALRPDDERLDNALAAGAPEAPSVTSVTSAAVDPESVAVVELDLTQYGEVRVTRRLYRDGTSEYMINNAPCRLRDVTDFFLGTGVGTKAYSIIEQGRIGMIVSAKPADRRLIIEEAAGITKFKKRKLAAERKMQQTRQNLLRVSDIVQELRSRLGSLRRQAQKAERYKLYKGEVRDIELWSGSHQLLSFGAQVRVLSADLSANADERDAKIAELEKREAAIIEERADCAIEERDLTELTQSVFELENQIKLAQSQIEYQTREAKDLDERAVASRGEIDALARQIGVNREEMGTVGASKKTLEAAVAERRADLGQLEQQQTSARTGIDEAQATLDAARTEIADAQTVMASTAQKQAALERRRDDLETRLGRITDEHGGLVHRQGEVSSGIAELNRTLGALRQMKLELGVQKEGLEVRLVDLKGQHEKTEAEVETLRTEAHRRRSRLQSLSEIQERYEGFARGTRAVMRHQRFGADKSGVRGLVADIVDTPAEYEAAVEAILGDRIGSILVDSQDVSLEAIDYLKSRSEGRSTFIPLSTFSMPSTNRGELSSQIEVVGGDGVRGPIGGLVHCKKEYAPIADYLFRDVVVVESLPRAIELWEAGLRKTLVTLDGDIVDEQGVVTGGSREATGAGVLQQKREIRELEEIIGALDHDLANATSRHVSCKAELSRVGTALDAAKKDGHQGEMDLLAQEKDLAGWQAESERHRERCTQLERERDELEDSLREVVRELAEALRVLVTATQKSADGESVQHSLVEKMNSAREHLELTNRALTECRVQQAQIDAECSSVQEQYRRLDAQSQELADRQQKLVAGISESTERAQVLRQEAAGLEKKLVEQSQSRGVRADELQARRNGYEQRLAALQVAEVDVRSVRNEAERRRAEVQSIETQLHELEIEMRHLDESVWERHRVQLAHVVSEFHLRAPVSEEEEQRLKELRRLIERMGEVNLTAIGEFEELSTRHEFLTTQQADLESALSQLERAITKINRTSRQLFKETFEEVNKLFQALFPRLFRGGRAYLRLTEEQDLLEAGVEIFAQPPGKKNTTVELLSGGEKALTAVSLIFAVFLYKPSPFCILDEVDAPLDEANVERFCDLIRELTDRSQFIVITHNKRTMEIADKLYGVTMQEPGCSKLVSVNLRGFAEEAA